mmetsp:Transcript_46052/g.99422  ORF Transcript_46052/g.99422 Transcript_46052/m.99422 type:complete len:120 (+) Transcript_46052:29-388(+)
MDGLKAYLDSSSDLAPPWISSEIPAEVAAELEAELNRSSEATPSAGNVESCFKVGEAQSPEADGSNQDEVGKRMRTMEGMQRPVLPPSTADVSLSPESVEQRLAAGAEILRQAEDTKAS